MPNPSRAFKGLKKIYLLSRGTLHDFWKSRALKSRIIAISCEIGAGRKTPAPERDAPWHSKAFLGLACETLALRMAPKGPRDPPGDDVWPSFSRAIWKSWQKAQLIELLKKLGKLNFTLQWPAFELSFRAFMLSLFEFFPKSSKTLSSLSFSKNSKSSNTHHNAQLLSFHFELYQVLRWGKTCFWENGPTLPSY